MKRSDNPCAHSEESLDKSLDALVRHYIKKCRPRSQSELEYYRKMPSLSVALEKAALAVNEQGKRFGHQRRLTSNSLEESKNRLFKVMIH